jgi:uncharacterized protein (TIGR00255 family)
MTAFARVERKGEWGTLIWELRSLNHRYLETFVRLPEELRALENKVRERAGAVLKRGKVECNLRYKADPAAVTGVQLNRAYAEQIVAVCEELGGLMGPHAPATPVELLRMPGILQEAEKDLSVVQREALSALDEALDELVAGRRREGERLRDAILQRADAMEPLVARVAERMPQVLQGVRERLLERLKEVRESMDETRIEQELVILAQKMDVDEELDRLGSHLKELRHTLERKEPVGRRLDFLMQEFNREANTLASKSADTEVTKVAVDLKVLIEQMREQVQNIE